MTKAEIKNIRELFSAGRARADEVCNDLFDGDGRLMDKAVKAGKRVVFQKCISVEDRRSVRAAWADDPWAAGFEDRLVELGMGGFRLNRNYMLDVLEGIV